MSRQECDLNKCTGAAEFYVFVEGFELAGFFTCAHDTAETKRRITLIANGFGESKVFVQKIGDLLPLQLIAIKAKRDGLV